MRAGCNYFSKSAAELDRDKTAHRAVCELQGLLNYFRTALISAFNPIETVTKIATNNRFSAIADFGKAF